MKKETQGGENLLCHNHVISFIDNNIRWGKRRFCVWLAFFLFIAIHRFQARSPTSNKRALNSRISSDNEETVTIGIRHLIEFLEIYSVGEEIKSAKRDSYVIES